MHQPQILGVDPNQALPPLPPDPVPRVQPKHNFEWYQDNRAVKIRIPLKGIAMKKMDVFVSDLILKINITEKKWVKILDLKHEVDFQSKENNVVYANETIEITVIKKEQGLKWEDLIEDTLSKEELKVRRQQSFQRKEETDKQFLKQRGDLKIKYDNHATKEMMRLEEEQRKVLDDRKIQEKNLAQNEIFGDIDNQGNIRKQNLQKEFSEKENFQQIETIQNIQNQKKIDIEEDQPQIIWTEKFYDHLIFNDDQLNRQLIFDDNNKPQIRQQSKLDIAFTERIYPNVAVREQHFKDAPMPKIKQGQQGKAGEDVENKNPLWLKDRGDEFYKNKDFYSAIMAYNQAYKIDSNMIQCVQNRAACSLHLFNYEEVLQDVDIIEQYYDGFTQDQKKQNKSIYIKNLLRKSIAISWKGNIDRGLEIIQKCLQEEDNLQFLKEKNLLQQFQDAKETIKKRIQSTIIKKQGDALFKEAKYQNALQKYLKSLEIDQNETAMGNISIAYLKEEKYAECIDYCNKCIVKVLNFTRFANFNHNNRSSVQDSNQFLIKLYLRKAKALQQMKQIQEAFEVIKQAIQINDKNTEAKQIFKSIERAFLYEELAKQKQQAAILLKNNEVRQALEIYNECLKKIDSTDTVEYLALLLNRCICYMKLEQYEDIISTCLRGLKIIRSYKNRVISWTSLKMSKEEKEKIDSFESRFLVRRANAYLKQNLVYNAKTDLEEAFKLDSNNEQLKQDIIRVNATISEQKQ